MRACLCGEGLATGFYVVPEFAEDERPLGMPLTVWHRVADHPNVFNVGQFRRAATVFNTGLRNHRLLT